MDLIQILRNFRKKVWAENLISIVFLKEIFLLRQLNTLKREALFIFSLYTKFFEYRYSFNLLIYYIVLIYYKFCFSMDSIQVLRNFRKKIVVFLKEIFLLRQLNTLKRESLFIFSLYTKFFEYRYSSNLLIYYIDLL